MNPNGLEEKIRLSREVLEEALARFEGAIALAWTGG